MSELDDKTMTGEIEKSKGLYTAGEGEEQLPMTPKELKRLRRQERRAEKKRKEAEKSFLQNFFETVAYVACVMLVALVIKTWVGQPVIISGDSMNDTLQNWNLVWANKLAYKPERFDVVIVESEKTDDKMYIKRVIAMPGETVFVDADDKIYITPADGGERYLLEDPYGYFSGSKKSQAVQVTRYTASHLNEEGGGKFSYTCGEGEYFVMGDNRYNSQDSRVLGAFSESEIKSHAVVRIWPLTKLGNFDKSNEEG